MATKRYYDAPDTGPTRALGQHRAAFSDATVLHGVKTAA